MQLLNPNIDFLRIKSVVERKQLLLKRQILKHLYYQPDQSTAVICKITNRSIPYINTVMEELKAEGYVIEVEAAESTGGRKAGLYSVNKSVAIICTVTMEKEMTNISFFNLANERIVEDTVFFNPISTQQKCLNNTIQMIQKSIKSLKIKSDIILAYGFSFPGLYDVGLLSNYTYFRELEQPLPEYLKQRLDAEIIIENDANAITLGEYYFGKYKKRKNLLCINISDGLGMGMILQGKLYRGKNGFAGELGQIKLVSEGPLSESGKRGSLESYVSNVALKDLVMNGISSGVATLLKEKILENNEKITPEIVISTAKSGDEFCIEIIQTLGIELGKGISVLVQLLNPEVILIHGKISQANQLLINPLKQTLDKFCLPEFLLKLKIEISKLGQESETLGLLSLVMQYVLHE